MSLVISSFLHIYMVSICFSTDFVYLKNHNLKVLFIDDRYHSLINSIHLLINSIQQSKTLKALKPINKKILRNNSND
ncbi:hypothetical protein DABAL43B_1214 [Psychrobacter sp. DAB_AL43B]|nr:hypothetical protein DABAL43B_1214 [Psychrobacter sp. DAB_AL43B]